jgi:phosphatidate phosphatase PAH1
MHTNAVKTFCVPKLQKSNNFVNVLTNEEKDCLEEAMGLPHNALSIYRQPKEDNYWSDANPNGFGRVTLTKHDNIFNLSDPADYARYKILLANKDIICPSMEEWSARPKETYEYVIIREGQETEISKDNTSAIIQAVMKLGKIAENKDTLQLVVETMMGKKFSSNTTKEYLQSQALSMIQNTPKNAKLFLNIIKDDNLDNKVLIRKCISKGIIADRGNHLFIKESNTPMCGDGEDPTINNAAKWLAEPKNQEILFSLQAKVKN